MRIVNDKFVDMTEGNGREDCSKDEVYFTVDQLDIDVLVNDGSNEDVVFPGNFYNIERQTVCHDSSGRSTEIGKLKDCEDLLALAYGSMEKSNETSSELQIIPNLPDFEDVDDSFGQETSEDQEDDEEIIQFLSNCFDSLNNKNVNINPVEPKMLEKERKSVEKEKITHLEKKVNNVVINYCQKQIINKDVISDACSKLKSKREFILPSTVQIEKSGFEKLDNLPKEIMQYFYPETREGVFEAIAKVSLYLQEEEKWTRKASRRTKMLLNQNPTRKSKITKPVISCDVQIYMKIGILPWEIKNRNFKPASDSECKVKLPNEIKEAILKYRSWYPTVQDKLYCFENHSKYLFDLELFGCWECIRKYFNEIYKWASNNGLVLREIKM